MPDETAYRKKQRFWLVGVTCGRPHPCIIDPYATKYDTIHCHGDVEIHSIGVATSCSAESTANAMLLA